MFNIIPLSKQESLFAFVSVYCVWMIYVVAATSTLHMCVGLCITQDAGGEVGWSTVPVSDGKHPEFVACVGVTTAACVSAMLAEKLKRKKKKKKKKKKNFFFKTTVHNNAKTVIFSLFAYGHFFFYLMQSHTSVTSWRETLRLTSRHLF